MLCVGGGGGNSVEITTEQVLPQQDTINEISCSLTLSLTLILFSLSQRERERSRDRERDGVVIAWLWPDVLCHCHAPLAARREARAFRPVKNVGTILS